ncbi:Pre-rRNA-processing protein TSR2-domain-containing protein [Scleroderma yunnanense]
MSSPSPIAILLARGVLARLALWPALRIAVYNSWGGPESAEKQRWLAGVLVDQFDGFLPASSAISTGSTMLGTPPDAFYIEEMLLQIMSDEFEVTLEDNSAFEAARDIVKLWNDVCAGKDALVKEWEGQAEKIKGKAPQVQEGPGSGSDWEDVDDGESGDDEESDGGVEGGEGTENAPQLLDHSRSRHREEPEVDEEGFTTIRRKGRR